MATNPLSLIGNGGRATSSALPALSHNVPAPSAGSVLRDITPARPTLSAGNALRDPRLIAQRSAERRASFSQLAEATAKAKKEDILRKAIVGTGVVTGTAVAGFGAYELYDVWAELPAQDRVSVAGEVGDAAPEIAELLRAANNQIASESRNIEGDFASYQPNRFGETHSYADRSVSGFGDVLDPRMNELQQAFDTTYALVRDRSSLARIKAEQFIYNNCSESDLNVLEDRYVARFG